MGKLGRLCSVGSLAALLLAGVSPVVAAPTAGAVPPLVARVAAPPSPRCPTVAVPPGDEQPPTQAPLTRTFRGEQASTAYSAPDTPRRMIPGYEYPVRVTVTNTTQQPLVAGRHVLSYHWTLPNGSDATAGTRLDTAFPANLAPGASVTLDARVRAPSLADLGTRLFVALSAGDAISVIDTSTLRETARYPTGAGTCPTHLARTGNLVWFGYGCVDGSWSGKIGKLDPAATEPVRGEQQGDVRFQRAPLLASSGAEGGPLVAGQLALSLSTVQVYSVAAGALTPGASGDVVGSGLTDLDVSADATLYSAAGSRDRVEAFATADLARRGVYAARPRPAAVSLSPDDAFVAAGALTTDNNDVLTYRIGGATPVRTIALDSGEIVQPRGLAWSADREHLFVITRHNNEPEPHLEIERHPVS